MTANPNDHILHFYVSTNGNDRWSGRYPAPNRSGTDGPFATVARAQRAVRALRSNGVLRQPVRVELRGGRYELREPWRLEPRDSGSPAPTGAWGLIDGARRDVTYAAYRHERPILSGGERLRGWKETTVHGRRAWVTHLPAVARGRWYFTQLWVNGRRATRPRLPRTGFFRIERPLGNVVTTGTDAHKILFTGQNEFQFAAGDLHAWRNVRDIEFVALHFWIESRIRFRHIDPVRRVARLQETSRMRLTDDFHGTGAPYYVENVFEALSEPGEWYLDRPTGLLHYLPRTGERIESTEVIAPRLAQLLIVQGNAKRRQAVAYVRIEGLTFSHTEWTVGRELHESTPQAASHIPGALSIRHARQFALRRCRIEHVGSYGIEFVGASSDCEVAHCRLTDLAGGGVKIWHSPDPSARRTRWWRDRTFTASCRRIIVRDNEIADGGIRFHQAVGVLIGCCSGNLVTHNHIHDFNYSGICVGWVWGYDESHAYGNVIEFNHLHHLGRGMLSDLGAVYTLGVSPGTRIRFNHIHDVQSRGFGGYGIYLDEGSSHILVECNWVYRTTSQGFHLHYGRDNTVRNNVFAGSGEGALLRSRLESHDSFVVAHNIFLTPGHGKIITGQWAKRRATFANNLYFDTARKRPNFAGRTWLQWQRLGADRHGLCADPRFVNAAKGDFRLRDGSPAPRLGFIPFDLRDVGPRPPSREAELNFQKHP